MIQVSPLRGGTLDTPSLLCLDKTTLDTHILDTRQVSPLDPEKVLYLRHFLYACCDCCSIIGLICNYILYLNKQPLYWHEFVHLAY